MKIRLVLIIILSNVFLSLYPQIVNLKPLSERITGYKLDVRLNPDKKTVTGDMQAF